LVLYEYPFNERVRTLLRLEDLFEKLAYFLDQAHPLQHHVVLVTLFEILDVASRADLKSDLLQELERQRQALQGLRENPLVDQDRLGRVLGEIEGSSAALGGSSGKPGQHLRDNDWLMGIRSRTIIPGGACEFDLPSYHAWQQRSLEARLADLRDWIAPFEPLHRCLTLALRLLRESGQRVSVVATQGQFQQMLAGKHYNMLQAHIDVPDGVFPEISANKYMVSVRFSQQGADLRAKPYEADVRFELTLCSF
jgi:cell division protein ZapD